MEFETRNDYQGVVTGVARVLALKQALASSLSQLASNETGLSIGTRSAIDVLNAQQQRYAAERDYQQARYDYLLSVLRLKSDAGRLAVQDVAEIDALLDVAGTSSSVPVAPAGVRTTDAPGIPAFAGPPRGPDVPVEGFR